MVPSLNNLRSRVGGRARRFWYEDQRVALEPPLALFLVLSVADPVAAAIDAAGKLQSAVLAPPQPGAGQIEALDPAAPALAQRTGPENRAHCEDEEND